MFAYGSSLPGWNAALRELENLRREFDRTFGSARHGQPMTAGVFPAINVTETGDALRVRAELPGARSEDLDVKVENDTLTIAGKRDLPEMKENASYHRREREWGQFRRSVTLPKPIDSAHVSADYVNGILIVTLPKVPEVRPRQIAIRES